MDIEDKDLDISVGSEDEKSQTDALIDLQGGVSSPQKIKPGRQIEIEVREDLLNRKKYDKVFL